MPRPIALPGDSAGLAEGKVLANASMRSAQDPDGRRRNGQSDPPASPSGSWFARWWRHVSSCLVSLLLHALLVVILGLWILREPDGAGAIGLVAAVMVETPAALLDLAPETAAESSTLLIPFGASLISSSQPPTRPLVPEVGAGDAATEPVRPWAGIEQSGDSQELLRSFDADVAGALAGRAPEARARLLLDAGGNPASEEAVRRGLRWLQAHQRSDGSWHFNHLLDGPCPGLCRHPGSEGTTTGATAMALLAFLGAGQTHVTGEHQQVVKDGLYYLVRRMLVTPDGGDLQEGTMYAQGLAAIALCEAYAMSRDATLEPYAQQAIDFIVYAQDKKMGGWRYFPGQPGDTTVTGWQLMALKSAQMAYLRVPPQTIFDATRFLDSVQSRNGAFYGYLSTGKQPTTTAIGLLCRMYTGWQREAGPLVEGVQYLSQQGPSQDNMYYNYYATQVMHHWGGDEWRAWNYRMRDFLIETQAADGHESGSWFFSGGQGYKGGRLYNTAMAVMTLEVYYRHLPLYGAESVDGSY